MEATQLELKEHYDDEMKTASQENPRLEGENRDYSNTFRNDTEALKLELAASHSKKPRTSLSCTGPNPQPTPVTATTFTPDKAAGTKEKSLLYPPRLH